MRCMICGKTTLQAGLLRRVNDLGKSGLWACDPHYRQARALHPDDDPRAPLPAVRPKTTQRET